MSKVKIQIQDEDMANAEIALLRAAAMAKRLPKKRILHW